MLSHHSRRPDLASSDHFSFSSPSSDLLDYDTWAANLKTLDNSFGKQNPNVKFGPWTRSIRLPDCRSSFQSSLDTSLPPLWKSSSLDSHSNVSRTQMISMYREEMMDLIRDLPETSYELSLRDIVELKKEKEDDEAGLEERWEMKKVSRRRRVRNGSRIGSMDSGGSLLKLFMPIFPAVLGRKISSRLLAVGNNGEWSSRGFQERSSSNSSNGSNGSNGSSDSSCSSGGRQGWKFGGCYSFFYRHRRSRSVGSRSSI